MAAISAMFKRKKTSDQIVSLLAKDLRDIAARGGADAKVGFVYILPYTRRAMINKEFSTHRTCYTDK